MSWQPIDYHGFMVLNRSFIEQLADYLEKCESRLANELLSAGRAHEDISLAPYANLKLSDAIEEVSKDVRQFLDSKKDNLDDLQKRISTTNKAFWEFIEILESSAGEFFQQLAQIGLEQWSPDFVQAVEKIKELLMHYLESTLWAVRRMDTRWQDYRTISEERKGKRAPFFSFLSTRKSTLDPALFTSIVRTEEYIKKEHERFKQRYAAYQDIESKAAPSMQKFKSYSVLASMETAAQTLFKKLYRLLKMWELNRKTRQLADQDFVLALRYLANHEKVLALFKEYYQLLNRALFDKSRAIKYTPKDLFYENSVRGLIRDTILHYKAELHTLAATVALYREFILESDPNPYKSSRLGFSETTVAEEPFVAKQLQEVQYHLDELDPLLESLAQSFDKGPGAEARKKVPDVEEEVLQHLHDMARPLISKRALKLHEDKILEKMQELNELGSFGHEVFDFVRDTLGRMLRLDWKFFVFNELPLFHKQMKIHQGILGATEDRFHQRRLTKFNDLVRKIETKAKGTKEGLLNCDIELELHDSKGYLQDFYASLQRLPQERGLDAQQFRIKLEEASQFLLEYRYLFGRFFHFLSQSHTEGFYLRTQFFFVDQYFESIEAKIQELRTMIPTSP